MQSAPAAASAATQAACPLFAASLSAVSPFCAAGGWEAAVGNGENGFGKWGTWGKWEMRWQQCKAGMEGHSECQRCIVRRSSR